MSVVTGAKAAPAPTSTPTSSSAALSLVASASMDTESDDGEPKLEIVDEPMAVDIKTEEADDASPLSLTRVQSEAATSISRPQGFGIFRKSISYDGGAASAASANTNEAAAVKRIKSIVEESNANDAIESLLMLGREPILSPQSRERSNSFSSSPNGRRFSNSSDAMDYAGATSSSTKVPQTKNGRDNFKGSMSYYQRMRERNNEASKRCRLKRRLKAETQEHQAHNLHMSNKVLRQRISKLEKICVVLKDGVKRIQSKDCKCHETVAKVKKTNSDCEDISNLSNRALIATSKTHRTQNIDLLVPGSLPVDESSMDYQPPPQQQQQHLSMPSTSSSPPQQVVPTSAPPQIIAIPGRSELSVTPVSKLLAPLRTPTTPQQPKKTALDAINDTIIQSLSAGAGSPPATTSVLPHANASSLPLNLVKIVPTTRPAGASAAAMQGPIASAAKQIILLAAPPRRTPPTPNPAAAALPLNAAAPVRSASLSSAPDDHEGVVIKCEPEVQIVECDPVSAPKSVSVVRDEPEDEGVDPTMACIAAAHGNAGCSGELLNLNKLTSYLELVSRNVARDSGKAAMERAIIKSRLRIPFWQADEVPTFICERHRYDLVHTSIMQTCSMCNKKRTKRANSPQSIMMTITYRMSLENYTTTGKILPIGLLVCSHCKEKHLKGVDFSNSQVIGPSDVPIESPGVSIPERLGSYSPSFCPLKTESSHSNEDEAKVTIQPVPRAQLHAIKVQPLSSAASSSGSRLPLQVYAPVAVAAAVEAGNGDVRPPDQYQQQASPTTPVPSSSTSPPVQNSGENIFTKISRLNDALQAINPSYKPIGFSITSIESCSQSVLEDATNATETAISTLLSVIAPQNEAFLWDSIKPKLDAKFLNGGQDIPQSKEKDKANANKNN